MTTNQDMSLATDSQWNKENGRTKIGKNFQCSCCTVAVNCLLKDIKNNVNLTINAYASKAHCIAVTRSLSVAVKLKDNFTG